MSNTHPSADLAGGASAAGALISLVSFVLSFFNSTHVWLQNMTLLVSLCAGCIAIAAGITKFVMWIRKIISEL